MRRPNVYVLCKLFEARCDAAMPKALSILGDSGSFRKAVRCMVCAYRMPAQRLPSILPRSTLTGHRQQTYVSLLRVLLETNFW